MSRVTVSYVEEWRCDRCGLSVRRASDVPQLIGWGSVAIRKDEDYRNGMPVALCPGCLQSLRVWFDDGRQSEA